MPTAEIPTSTGAVRLIIDDTSVTPPFEQVKEQLATARDAGLLDAGLKLPTVRALAAELNLAPNTVARAYRELEAQGVLETKGRHGSFVTGTASSARKAAAAAARQYADAVQKLGISDDAALDFVVAALYKAG